MSACDLHTCSYTNTHVHTFAHMHTEIIHSKVWAFIDGKTEEAGRFTRGHFVVHGGKDWIQGSQCPGSTC